MRDTDRKEKPPELGKPLPRPAPTLPPLREETGRIITDPDGKMRTNMPENEVAKWGYAFRQTLKFYGLKRF